MTSSKGQLKCNRCPVCDGYGCPGNLPGLGGVFESRNFQLNCEGWEKIYKSLTDSEQQKVSQIKIKRENLRCGPVTGAVENIGYNHEEDFYYSYLKKVYDAGFGLCVGDGCPDLKIQLGIEAVKKLKAGAAGAPANGAASANGAFSSGGTASTDGAFSSGAASSTAAAPTNAAAPSAAFFLKPYPQEKLFERIEWVKPCADFIGIDIDSYNILTMRNLVHLERKTEKQLEEFRSHFEVPFVLKGVFTEADMELVQQAKPDVVYISNHGGRVETRTGSTADFLAAHAKELKKHCKQIWVDGGIRSEQDVQTALYLGADQVIAARPFIRATFDEEDIKHIFGIIF